MATSLSIRKGVSHSRDPVQAAAALFAALDQPNIKLAIVYCSPDYDLPTLAHELHRCFGDINLIGCTTAGEITPQGYLQGSLTGVSLAGTKLDVVVQPISLTPFDSDHTGKTVQQALQRLSIRDGLAANAADSFAFMLIDGLAFQEEQVVSCLYRHLQGIEMAGGSAADGLRFQAAHLYYQGQFQQQIALLALVRTDLPFQVFRTQHFVKSDTHMVVSKADPARRLVYEINGAPAASEFARLIGLPMSALSPQVFAVHPVLVRVGNQYFVRSITEINPDQSLRFLCAIETGVTLTIASGVDMANNLHNAFMQVATQIGAPQLVLGCDCILRRLECEQNGINEQIGQIFMDNNVIGFATYGEQFNAVHVNQTFTGIAIGRND